MGHPQCNYSNKVLGHLDFICRTATIVYFTVQLINTYTHGSSWLLMQIEQSKRLEESFPEGGVSSASSSLQSLLET